ncbi:MAG: hypothetical protein Q7V57_16360 [Actinomycetota bacterium]|nr:hypothetical protein [Actinomycetota bacterium]
MAFFGGEGFEGFDDDAESSGRDSALGFSAEGCGVDECDSLVGLAGLPVGEADIDETADRSCGGRWVDAERGGEFAHGPAAVADEEVEAVDLAHFEFGWVWCPGEGSHFSCGGASA